MISDLQLVERLAHERFGLTIDRIIEMAGSESAAYRQLRRLEQANVAILRDKDLVKTRYKLDRERYLVLLPDELAALLVYLNLGAAHGLADTQAEQVVEGLFARATGKPGELPLQVATEARGAAPHIRTVERGIKLRHPVRCVYLRGEERTPTPKVMEVHQISVRQNGKQYAEGWDRMSQGWRSFVLSRMTEVELLPETFEWRADYKAHVGQPQGPVEAVCIRVDAQGARLLDEYPLHPEQTVARLDDGCVEVRATMSVFDAKRWLHLRYGHAQVLAPEGLRAEFLADLERGVALNRRAALSAEDQVLECCAEWRTVGALVELTGRARPTLRKVVRSLFQAGRLEALYADRASHPKQAYRRRGG